MTVRLSVACLALLMIGAPALARRCEVNGEAVNPDNGSTTAGKTGIQKCYRDDGTLWHEQELRNGRYLGLDRMVRDDGSVSERQINANGNTEGLAREFYPDGKLKQEGQYRNGDAVGLIKSYHPDGRLAALRFHPRPGGQAAVAIEYNRDGSLHELRCATQSLIDEDRALCGFGKAVTHELRDANGSLREKRSYREGQAIGGESFDRQGHRRDAFERDGKRSVERRYFDTGEVASESTVVDGYEVAASEWYMNGKLKTRTRREAALNRPKASVEHYRDTGVLQVREELLGSRRTHEERFDEAGLRSEEFLYDEDARPTTHRKFSADGQVVLEEAFYPDGSRKVIKGEAKIAQ
jgi:antitoxin component YwqK of YwqJK toxin-antitoxin module